MKYMKEFITSFIRRPAFSTIEVKNFLERRGASKGYFKLMLQNLEHSQRIHRITKGSYTFHEEVQFVGYAFYPFYYGLEDALTLRGIWGQQTNPVVITPRKVRPGIREFHSRNYFVRRIQRKLFFGYALFKYQNFFIPVSDVEKTLIDIVHFRSKIPKETIAVVIDKCDKAKLCIYTNKLPPYLAERMKALIVEYS